MGKKPDDQRLAVKLSKSTSNRLRKLARDSAMNLSIPQLVESALNRSWDWLEANTPRKARP